MGAGGVAVLLLCVFRTRAVPQVPGAQTWPRAHRVPTGAEPCVLKAERFLYCVNSWLPVP